MRLIILLTLFAFTAGCGTLDRTITVVVDGEGVKCPYGKMDKGKIVITKHTYYAGSKSSKETEIDNAN